MINVPTAHSDAKKPKSKVRAEIFNEMRGAKVGDKFDLSEVGELDECEELYLRNEKFNYVRYGRIHAKIFKRTE